MEAQIIEFIDEDKKAIYHSTTRTVTHFTKNGVCMECEVPKDWALTRVFQFMDSLLENSQHLV